MVEINLLPWRAHIRQKKQRKSKILFYIILSCMLSMGVAYFMLDREMNATPPIVAPILTDDHRNQENNRPNQTIFLALNKIQQAGAHHVQMISVSYASDQLKIIGAARSMQDILQWQPYLKIMAMKNKAHSLLFQFKAIVNL